MKTYKPLKVRPNNGRRIECEAALIAEYTTNRDGRKSQWQDLECHETPGGVLIAVLIGRSTAPGHRDLVTAACIDPRKVGIDKAQDMAMEIWRYGDAAYAMAKILGWDPVDRPD